MNKKKLKSLKTLNLSSSIKPQKKIKKSKNCDLSQKISEKEFLNAQKKLISSIKDKFEKIKEYNELKSKIS